MSSLAVRARALSKRYGDLEAVRGIDFDIENSAAIGVLGPNGAGKTTTVKMVSCFLPITAGTIEVFGLDVARHPREVKARLGICHQENNLDPDLSVRKNLLVWSRYFDLPRREASERIDELLAAFQLQEKRDAQIEQLSGGMKRRLVLARALLNRPRLLVLDEPTTGLDPQARQAIWQRVRKLREDGVTVLLTTHYMEEASQLCDRVILMDQGRILLEGPPAQLVAREAGSQVVELWNLSPAVREFVERAGWRLQAGEERLYLFDRGEGIAEIIATTFPQQDRLIRHATLEDVFLLHAGRTLKEGT